MPLETVRTDFTLFNVSLTEDAEPGRYEARVSANFNSYQNAATASVQVSVPVSMTLTATAGQSQVALAWTEPLYPVSVTNFKVLRRLDSSSSSAWTQIATTTTRTYTDTTVVPDTVYLYKIEAVNDAGKRGFSNQARSAPYVLPDTPSDLAAQSGVRQVQLSWSRTARAQHYVLERSSASGAGFEVIGSFINDAPSADNKIRFNDTNVLPNQTYYYRVYSVNAGGQRSANSNEAVGYPKDVISCGDKVSGVLATNAAASQGWLTRNQAGRGAHRYQFIAQAGQEITVTLKSPAFNSSLFLLNASGGVVALNNNAGLTATAQIVYRFQTGGVYTIEATANVAGAAGPYEMAVCCSDTTGLPAVYSGLENIVPVTGNTPPTSAQWEIYKGGVLVADAESAHSQMPLHWAVYASQTQGGTRLHLWPPTNAPPGQDYEVRYQGYPATLSAFFQIPCETVSDILEDEGIGLKGEYHHNSWPSSESLVATRIDPTVNFMIPLAPGQELWTAQGWICQSLSLIVPGVVDPSEDGYFSVRWSGSIKPRHTEEYTFYLTTDDGARLWIDGKLIVDGWYPQYPSEYRGIVRLEANKKYDIRIEYFNSICGQSVCRLEWESASQTREVVPQSRLYPDPPYAGLFSLSAEPAFITALQDDGNGIGGGYSTITLTPYGSFSEDVLLSLAGAPAGMSGQFSPTAQVSHNSRTSRLDISPSLQTEPGVYPVLVAGTFGTNNTQSAVLTVAVKRSFPDGKRPRVAQGSSKSFPAEGSNFPAQSASTWDVVLPWGEVLTDTVAAQRGWKVTLDSKDVFLIEAPQNAWVAENYQVRLRRSNNFGAGAYSGFFDVIHNSSRFNVAPSPLTCPPVGTNATVNGSLVVADAPSWFDPSNAGIKADHFFLPLKAGQKLRLTNSSNAFAPCLYLLDPTGQVVAMNAQPLPGGNAALIEYTASRGGTYLLEVTAAPTNPGLGAYQVIFNCSDADSTPLVEILSPPNNALVPTGLPSLTLRVKAQSGDVIDRVYFVGLPGGGQVDAISSGNNEYTYTWLTPPANVYTLKAFAVNSANKTGESQPVQVTVSADAAMRLNLAGGEHTDTDGYFWLADNFIFGSPGWHEPFGGGGAGQFIDWEVWETTRFSQNEDEWGVNLPATANASYLLRLVFFDPYAQSAGQKFHITVNDQQLLNNLDVFQELASGSGDNRLVKNFAVTGYANGLVRLRLKGAAGVTGSTASLAALELIPNNATSLPEILCGQTLSGASIALTTTDGPSIARAPSNDFYADRYRITLQQDQVLTLTAHAVGAINSNNSFSGFDPHVYISRVGDNRPLAGNNNLVGTPPSGLNRWDSRLVFVAPETGTYIIEVTSAADNEGGVGEYMLTAACGTLQSLAPAAPSHLVAEALANPDNNDLDSIRLKWRDNSGDESGFVVERAQYQDYTLNLGPWVKVKDLDGNVAGHVDGANIAPSKVYAYRVRAFTLVGGTPIYSAYTPLATAHTHSVPPVIAIQTPLESFRVQPGSQIAVDMAASGSKNASVQKVELFANGVLVASKIGTGSGPITNPVRLYFTPPVVGSYVLTARVTDNYTLSSLSAPVGVTAANGNTLPPPSWTQIGIYKNSQNQTTGYVVALSCPVGEASIHYTLDGSLPTVFSPRYTGPIVIARQKPTPANPFPSDFSTTLRAATFRSEMDGAEMQAAPFAWTGTPDAANNTVTLTKPGDGQVVTGITPVWGSVGGNQAGQWTLSFRALENPASDEKSWTRISSGVDITQGAVYIGDFDPTILGNGAYELRLQVFDLLGGVKEALRSVVVQGGTKVGAFTLPSTDLVLPSPLMPLAVGRVYNSTDKTVGDFGVGWRLSVSQAKAEKPVTVPAAGSQPVSSSIGLGWKQVQGQVRESKPHYVIVTLPSGEVFPFAVRYEDWMGGGEYGFVYFEPTSGNTATLVRHDEEILFDGLGTKRSPISVYPASDGTEIRLHEDDGAGPGGPILDVNKFVLITRDGTRYTIRAEAGVGEPAGLLMVVDRKLNTLERSVDGAVETFSVERPDGAVVRQAKIHRNVPGGYVTRVEEIVGQNPGRCTLYGYTSGMLTSFQNLEGKITTYRYDDFHNMLEVKSPQVMQAEGAPVQPWVKNHYDPAGRLVATEDSAGKATTFGHNVSARREVITDRSGNQSLMAYDAYGNVTRTAGYLKVESGGQTITKIVEATATYGNAKFPDRKTSESARPDSSNTLAPPLVTSYAYTDKGDPLLVETPRSHPEAGSKIATRYEYKGPNWMGEQFGEVKRVLVKGPPAFIDGEPTWKAVTTNEYDDFGKLLWTRDALGAKTEYFYEDPTTSLDDHYKGGLVKAVKSADGKSLTVYDYYKHGDFNKTTDLPDARVGLLKSVRVEALPGNAVLSATRYEYDERGNKTKQVALRKVPGNPSQWEDHAVTTYVYDGGDRLVKTVSPEQQGQAATSAITEYNELGKVKQRTDMHNRVTKYFYNGKGETVKTVSPDLRESHTEYDADGRVKETWETVPGVTGKVRRSLRFYDSLGRQVRSETWGGNPNAPPMVSTTVYDDLGRVLSQTDHKNTVSATDDVTTYSTYDEAGNVTNTYTETVGGPFGGGGNQVSTQYDGENRPFEVTDARGNVTKTEYDAAGRVVKVLRRDINHQRGSSTETAYDTLGRRVLETLKDESATPATVLKRTAFGYNDLGRLVSVTQVMDLPNWPSDPQNKNLVTTYTYDEAGNKLSQTDAKGRVTKFEYDKNGRIVKRTLPMGQFETMAYDSVTGRMLHKTAFTVEGGTPSRRTLYVYYDNLSEVATFGKLKEKRPQTWNGSAWVTTDPNAANAPPDYPTHYTYYDAATNGLNQGKSKTVTHGGVQTVYEYDADGRLWKRHTDTPEGGGGTRRRSVVYGYNSLSEKVSVSTAGVANGVTISPVTTGYEYDELGRMTAVVHAAGARTEYEYNEVGSLQKVTRRNAAGQAKVTSEYLYDEKNQLSQIVHKNGSGAVLGQFDYVVDASGKRTQVTETLGSGSIQVVTTYTYDAAGRLIGENFGGGSRVTNFTLDKVGNRDGLEVYNNNTLVEATSYTYDNNDRLLARVMQEAGQPLATFQHFYDAAGNTIQVVEKTGTGANQTLVRTTELVYTFENRLFSQGRRPGGWLGLESLAEYNYDGEGHRVSLERKQWNAQGAGGIVSSQEFLLDTEQPYAEVMEEYNKQTGDWVARYEFGLDRLLMDRNSGPGNEYFYLYDGLGSAKILTDVQGAVVEQYAYEAFGKPIVTGYTLDNTNLVNDFLFNGQQFDALEGLYFLRARYYGPGIGRFLNEDPLLGDEYEPITLHRYLYAATDGINNTDPTGEYTLSNVLITSSIVGGLSGAVVGGVRDGWRGAISGLIMGAIMAPIITYATIAGGAFIAVASGGAISATSATFGIGLAVSAFSVLKDTIHLLQAKNEREKFADGLSIVLTLGMTGFGAYKFSETPNMPNIVREAGQPPWVNAIPRSKQQMGEMFTEFYASTRGEYVIDREVTIRPNGMSQQIRADFLVRDINGNIKIIESKFGPSARLTPNQKQGLPLLNQNGGVVTIPGQRNAVPVNTQLPANTEVRIDMWR